MTTPLYLIGLFKGRRLAIASFQNGLAGRDTNRNSFCLSFGVQVLAEAFTVRRTMGESGAECSRDSLDLKPPLFRLIALTTFSECKTKMLEQPFKFHLDRIIANLISGVWKIFNYMRDTELYIKD